MSCIIQTIVISFCVLFVVVFSLLLALYHRDNEHRLPAYLELVQSYKCLKCANDQFEEKACSGDFATLLKVKQKGGTRIARGLRAYRTLSFWTFRTKVEDFDFRLLLVNSSRECRLELKQNHQYFVTGKFNDLQTVNQSVLDTNLNILRPVINNCGLVLDWTKASLKRRSELLEVLKVSRLCEKQEALNFTDFF